MLKQLLGSSNDVAAVLRGTTAATATTTAPPQPKASDGGQGGVGANSDVQEQGPVYPSTRMPSPFELGGVNVPSGAAAAAAASESDRAAHKAGERGREPRRESGHGVDKHRHRSSSAGKHRPHHRSSGSGRAPRAYLADAGAPPGDGIAQRRSIPGGHTVYTISAAPSRRASTLGDGGEEGVGVGSVQPGDGAAAQPDVGHDAEVGAYEDFAPSRGEAATAAGEEAREGAFAGDGDDAPSATAGGQPVAAAEGDGGAEAGTPGSDHVSTLLRQLVAGDVPQALQEEDLQLLLAAIEKSQKRVGADGVPVESGEGDEGQWGQAPQLLPSEDVEEGVGESDGPGPAYLPNSDAAKGTPCSALFPGGEGLKVASKRPALDDEASGQAPEQPLRQPTFEGPISLASEQSFACSEFAAPEAAPTPAPPTTTTNSARDDTMRRLRRLRESRSSGGSAQQAEQVQPHHAQHAQQDSASRPTTAASVVGTSRPGTAYSRVAGSVATTAGLFEDEDLEGIHELRASQVGRSCLHTVWCR